MASRSNKSKNASGDRKIEIAGQEALDAVKNPWSHFKRGVKMMAPEIPAEKWIDAAEDLGTRSGEEIEKQTGGKKKKK